MSLFDKLNRFTSVLLILGVFAALMLLGVIVVYFDLFDFSFINCLN